MTKRDIPGTSSPRPPTGGVTPSAPVTDRDLIDYLRSRAHYAERELARIRNETTMAITGLGEGHPIVAGYCPTCGFHSLYLATGGYITCAIPLCPDPMAAHKLLNPEGAAE